VSDTAHKVRSLANDAEHLASSRHPRSDASTAP